VKVPQPSTASAIIGAGLSIPALLQIIEQIRKQGTTAGTPPIVAPGGTSVGTPPGGTSNFFG